MDFGNECEKLGVIILIHEAWDCVADLCLNIYRYCGKGTSIYLHCSKALWNNPKNRDFMNILPNDIKIFFSPKIWNKELFTCDLLKAYLEVIEFAEQKKHPIEYWMLLTSNCLFVEPFSSWKQKTNNHHLFNPKWMWWNKIFHPFHHRIQQHFQAFGIPFIGHYHHEGTVLPHSVWQRIIQHLRKYPFLINDKPIHFPGEEFILPSLEYYYTGKLSRRCCKYFIRNPGGRFYPKDIYLIEDAVSVKRVPRVLNDPVRLWIRNKMITDTSCEQTDSPPDHHTHSAPQNTPPTPATS
jgi:hypothetical protein